MKLKDLYVPKPVPKKKIKNINFKCPKCLKMRHCLPDVLQKHLEEGCGKCIRNDRRIQKKRSLTMFKQEVSRGRYGVLTHNN